MSSYSKLSHKQLVGHKKVYTGEETCVCSFATSEIIIEQCMYSMGADSSFVASCAKRRNDEVIDLAMALSSNKVVCYSV